MTLTAIDPVARALAVPLNASAISAAGGLLKAQLLQSSDGSLRTQIETAANSYSAGINNFTPDTAPTDIFRLGLNSYGSTAKIKRITVSGVATNVATVASIDVFLQRSVNGGAGTSTACQICKHDNYDAAPVAAAYYYTVNRTSNGNGVSSTRPIIRAGRMTFATATTTGVPIVWEFGLRGSKSLYLKDINDWIVLNLNGQTMPTGATLSIDIEWQEDRVVRIGAIGDSTTSNATIGLFNGGSNSGGIGLSGQLNSLITIDNRGSNGFRLIDYLYNTNGVTYPQANVAGFKYDVHLFCYGINDIRTGATTKSQLIDMIDAYIWATLNGTVSGATYTATKAGGAGTVFTWTSSVSANPDTKIILWGPQGFTADDSGSGSPFYYMSAAGNTTLSGLWAGMTLAQAALAASQLMYDAYQAFSGDPRIFALVQKQDLTMLAPDGATTVYAFPTWRGVANLANTPITAANSASQTMANQIHPGARGQVLEARQIAPYIVGAFNAFASNYF